MNPVLEALVQAAASQAGAARGSPDTSARRGAPAPAWAEGALPLSALAVEVDGLGPLAQPLAPAQAEALHAASTPARYGLREQTLLDTRVRHTGEINADQVALGWAPGAFQALQVAVARGLGLPAVHASLHALLVYGPGQFFKPHQDTEKHPGMVATLVLVWPSAHIGGALQLSQQAQAGRFESQHLQAPALRWLAFYADCRHEVLPVSEGWRVVLTFDLMLPPAAPLRRSAPDPALVAALRAEFFETTPIRRAPWVLLLDHEYTEQGLRWSLLKGDDRRHAPALRAAAEALGLQARLALAEVHEVWQATVAPHSRRGQPARPVPDELIDDSVTLDFWVDADDRVLPRPPQAPVIRDVQSFVPTDERFLVDEAYEGYMGNWGETLDYWYRRAAVVLQSPQGIEADRFDQDFDTALGDALALARQPGQAAVLAQRLALAASALQRQFRQVGHPLWPAYAELALALDDADQAQALIKPMPWAQLQPADVPALAALARRWGPGWVLAWWREQAQQAMRTGATWTAAGSGQTSTLRPWPSPLPDWVQALGRAELDDGVRHALLSEVFTLALAMVQSGDRQLATATPARRQSGLASRLAAMAELLAALQGPPFAGHDPAGRGLQAAATRWLESLIAHVDSQPLLYPPLAWRPLVEALGPRIDTLPAARALREGAVFALRQALASPQPADDDARLDARTWSCRCRDCEPVRQWLASADGRPLVLAMAEERRRHLARQVDDSGLPLATETLKQGSPYKLRLAKPDDLPARRQALREAWAADLAALNGA